MLCQTMTLDMSAVSYHRTSSESFSAWKENRSAVCSSLRYCGESPIIVRVCNCATHVTWITISLEDNEMSIYYIALFIPGMSMRGSLPWYGPASRTKTVILGSSDKLKKESVFSNTDIGPHSTNVLTELPVLFQQYHPQRLDSRFCNAEYPGWI